MECVVSPKRIFDTAPSVQQYQGIRASPKNSFSGSLPTQE